jgi:hypothetical protein
VVFDAWLRYDKTGSCAVEGEIMRAVAVRAEVERLLHQVPYRPFLLALENGERVVIEHPENIAFDPGPTGSPNFYVLSGRLRLYSTFEGVSNVAMLEPAERQEQEGAA